LKDFFVPFAVSSIFLTPVDCPMLDELLDVVNDKDIVIGRESRAVVHRRGLQHRGVHIFLFTREGKWLIQQRSKDRAASPSLLDCSVSEHVQAGESYLGAALRGMREELGLQQADIKEIATFSMNYGSNDNEISRLFQGYVDPSQVQFDPVEIERVAYYDFRELLQLMETGGNDFCYWFKQIINWAVGKPTALKILSVQADVRLPWLPVE